MKKQKNIPYGIATLVVIAICVWFHFGYVNPRLHDSFEIPTSYMSGNYRELDSMAICNGDVEGISCFFYMLPRAYNIGYDMIMANRYKDAESYFLFFQDLLNLMSKDDNDYSFDQLNIKLENMNDSLRVIALRLLSHCDCLHRQEGEDSISVGNYVSLYDSICRQEHMRKKGGDSE